MTGKTSRQLDKFVVRFPDGMRDQVAARAGRNHRSMNQEVVASMDAADKLEKLKQTTDVTERCYVDRIKLLEATMGELLKAPVTGGATFQKAIEVLAAKN